MSTNEIREDAPAQRGGGTPLTTYSSAAPEAGESRQTSHRYCTPSRRPQPIPAPFGAGCRYCLAIAGEQCLNKITGRPLRRGIAHPIRILDAQRAQEILDA